MYNYWYGFLTPKFRRKFKLCYTDTCSFIVHKNINVNLVEFVETRFDISYYEVNRQLLIGKNENVICLMNYGKRISWKNNESSHSTKT